MGSSARCRRRVRRRFREALVQTPGQVQQGSREGLGGLGAEPRQVQHNPVWETLAQSHITFNRVPERVPEKVWEALVQSQVRFNRVSERRFRRRSGRVWCRKDL